MKLDDACCHVISLPGLHSNCHSQRSTIKSWVNVESLECVNDSIVLLLVQVRWYSFQFNMQQLAEELKEAFAALNNVLTCLPARSAHRH